MGLHDRKFFLITDNVPYRYSGMREGDEDLVDVLGYNIGVWRRAETPSTRKITFFRKATLMRKYTPDPDTLSLLDGQVCIKCNSWQSYDNFHISKTSRSGRDTVCKKCCLERNRARYHKNHDREKLRLQVSVHRHRAQKFGVPGTFTVQEWLDVCAKHEHKCAECNQSRFLTIDHIIPFVAGGSNYIENIQPLCQPCNTSKRARIGNKEYAALQDEIERLKQIIIDLGGTF